MIESSFFQSFDRENCCWQEADARKEVCKCELTSMQDVLLRDQDYERSNVQLKAIELPEWLVPVPNSLHTVHRASRQCSDPLFVVSLCLLPACMLNVTILKDNLKTKGEHNFNELYNRLYTTFNKHVSSKFQRQN